MIQGEKRVAEVLEASAELRRVNAALRHRVARGVYSPHSFSTHTLSTRVDLSYSLDRQAGLPAVVKTRPVPYSTLQTLVGERGEAPFETVDE